MRDKQAVLSLGKFAMPCKNIETKEKKLRRKQGVLNKGIHARKKENVFNKRKLS